MAESKGRIIFPVYRGPELTSEELSRLANSGVYLTIEKFLEIRESQEAARILIRALNEELDKLKVWSIR